MKISSKNLENEKMRQMIHYSMPLIGSGLAFWGLTTLDKVLLRSLSGFEELGIYALAVSFAAAGLILQSIFLQFGPLLFTSGQRKVLMKIK